MGLLQRVYLLCNWVTYDDVDSDGRMNYCLSNRMSSRYTCKISLQSALDDEREEMGPFLIC